MKITLLYTDRGTKDNLGISLSIRETDINKLEEKLKPFCGKEIDLKEILEKIINERVKGSPFENLIKIYIKRLKI